MSQKQRRTKKPSKHRSLLTKQQIIQKQVASEKRPLSPTASQPQSITPATATQLQRTIGNQALGRLLHIQPKLTLGPVNDKYEQEADTVAKQVVNRISSSEQTPQRQENESVLTKPENILQRQEDEEDIQMKPLPIISTLQRQEEDEIVQGKSTTMHTGGELDNDVETDVNQAKSSGQPLTASVRNSMESAFNTDFSGVKIHTDNQSDRLNQSIQARAFTTGQDIFFRQGEYNPENTNGQELLAHELTHTIQQTGGQAQRQIVQRLIKTRDFMSNASVPKKKKKGAMSDLIHALDAYQVQEAFLSLHPSESHYTTVLQLLDVVETKAKAWQNTTGKSLGVGRFFRKKAGTRHKSKKTAVSTLLNEITTEREVLTKKKENLQTQQEMLTALDETQSRPDMATSYMEQPLTETDPELLVKKLELSQKVINIQIEELLKRKTKGETLDEDEITAVGKSLQGLNVVAGQLFSIADYKKGTTTITGKFEESLKGALEAQVKGSDPKKLYTYTHLGDTVGMGLEAKEVTAAVHTAVRIHLDENEQTETTVNFHIGNTNTGKLIREAQMWLCNPVIKSLYDLYISDPTEFEKMAGLMEPDRVTRLIGIVMQVPGMVQKALDLPGGEQAFKLSGATFY